VIPELFDKKSPSSSSESLAASRLRKGAHLFSERGMRPMASLDSPSIEQGRTRLPASHSFHRTALSILRAIQVRLRIPAILLISALVVGRWDLIRNHWDKLTRQGSEENIAAQAVSRAKRGRDSIVRFPRSPASASSRFRKRVASPFVPQGYVYSLRALIATILMWSYAS
jgi:hypothetical protein